MSASPPPPHAHAPLTGVALGEACTIVLRGASSHILDEAERSLHDALCVLHETVKDSRVLYGGGWSEMRMARAIEEAAAKTPGGCGVWGVCVGRGVRAWIYVGSGMCVGCGWACLGV
jgi:T-complex protein 1 subunit beta